MRGIAFRDNGRPVATAPAPVIRDLDAYRVGWELIDHSRYSYWGGLRAVVVQFSRGCPHLCNYCGQRGFWTRWRHRDPVRFRQGAGAATPRARRTVINFADENPTVSRKAWRPFLEALIAENVDLILVGSTRAGDIVRDADILHLYKSAGWERFLLGMENTDEKTLDLIRKGATARSIARQSVFCAGTAFCRWRPGSVGFEEETDRDYWRGLRQLLSYDPDQIQMLYVTPHRWTPYYRLAAGRTVIQTDRRRWDYKHQVLATRHMRPWRVLLWFKFIEMVMQTRPKRALSRAAASRPRLAARHALVHADGPAGMAVRNPQLPARPAAQGRPDRRGILGRRAGRRGRVDGGSSVSGANAGARRNSRAPRASRQPIVTIPLQNCWPALVSTSYLRTKVSRPSSPMR